MSRSLLAVLLALAPLAAFAGEAPPETPPAQPPTPPEAPQEEKLAPGTYARLKTSKGEILIRLFEAEAPETVKNFVELAKGERPWKDAKGRWVAKPFYNGLSFHRVEADDLIAGGCPKGDGTGGPGYEFANEDSETLKFDRPGLVGMENAGYNRNGSQFFITLKPRPDFDRQKTLFGEVVGKGLDAAREISKLPARPRRNESGLVHVPQEPPVIESVTIEKVKAGAAPPAEPPAANPQE